MCIGILHCNISSVTEAIFQNENTVRNITSFYLLILQLIWLIWYFRPEGLFMNVFAKRINQFHRLVKKISGVTRPPFSLDTIAFKCNTARHPVHQISCFLMILARKRRYFRNFLLQKKSPQANIPFYLLSDAINWFLYWNRLFGSHTKKRACGEVIKNEAERYRALLIYRSIGNDETNQMICLDW